MMAIIQSLGDFIQFDFLMLGMIASLMLALICALLSPFVVAKNLAFYSSALSHSTFLSLGVCYLILINPTNHQIFAFVLAMSLLLGQILSWGSYHQKLPADSLVGLYFTGAMGLGILLLEKNGSAAQKITTYLFGNLLLVEPFMITALFLLLVISLFFIFLYEKELLLWCWNPDIARISLKNTFFLHCSLFALITITLVLGLQVAGIIPMSSLIIVPGMFSSLFAKNRKEHFLYAILFSLCTTFTGTVLSNFFNFSLGPAIASFQVIVFLIFLPVLKFGKAKI